MGFTYSERSGTFHPCFPLISNHLAIKPITYFYHDHQQGMVNIAGSPCVAYDPSGAVFAVCLNLRSTLLLYDLKNFDKQPFVNVQLIDPVLATRSFPSRVPILTSLKFSNCGKWILVGTGGDTSYVVDAFDGKIVARLEGTF